ncbi:MAG: CYTH domain-containing protein [Planctomycetota bacterium]|jgi:CYTH domain-containing protein
MSVSGDGREIERKYVLTAAPTAPADAIHMDLEQGYLAPGPGIDVASPAFAEGRLRRERHVDGAVVHTHTVKRGAGMVRQEQEREITLAEFDAAWPRTAGARIAKHRYEVRVGEHLWVVDEFKGRDLVLAEVEMPRPDENPAVPVWLAPFIDRDVTNDPAFRNFALARQLAGES